MKKLYRSRTNRILAGILGGLGDYYSIDATVLRIFAILGILITGLFPGVIAYIIAIFIIPEEPVRDVPPSGQM